MFLTTLVSFCFLARPVADFAKFQQKTTKSRKQIVVSWSLTYGDGDEKANLTVRQCFALNVNSSEAECRNHAVAQGVSTLTLNSSDGTNITLILYQGHDKIVAYNFVETPAGSSKLNCPLYVILISVKTR